jgi:hypothetical protein
MPSVDLLDPPIEIGGFKMIDVSNRTRLIYPYFTKNDKPIHDTICHVALKTHEHKCDKLPSHPQ